MAVFPWGASSCRNNDKIITMKGIEMSENPKLVEEIKKMEYEPLLPIEMKLIRWSIGLGIGLLILLYFISRMFTA